MASGRSAAWFSALAWGARGRPFESARPDHFLLIPFSPFSFLLLFFIRDTGLFLFCYALFPILRIIPSKVIYSF